MLRWREKACDDVEESERLAIVEKKKREESESESVRFYPARNSDPRGGFAGPSKSDPYVRFWGLYKVRMKMTSTSEVT